MATLKKTILETATQPVSARYEPLQNKAFPTPQGLAQPQSQEAVLRLVTRTGEPISCQRHNGQWYNFILPAEAPHLWLEVDATGPVNMTITELTVFIGEREQVLPVPIAAARHGNADSGQEDATRFIKLELPAIPHWMQGLLCVRLAPSGAENTDLAA